MSPSKKRVKRIKVHVPRHNSQRIGPALTAQIETIAKEKRIRTDVRQPTNEATSVIALAIVGPRLSHSPFLRADRNTRKVLPNGTRCYLPLVPSGAHSGTWVHNSESLRKNPSIYERARIVIVDFKSRRIRTCITTQLLC